jgi:cyclopropane fatty-acyl-phospholipid synthase-like methyltransferase
MQSPETDKDDLRDLYRDDYVSAYHQHPGPRLEHLVDRADLSNDMTVADLGCGNGLLLDVLHGRVENYHGVDFSNEFIAEARQRHAGLESDRGAFAFHVQSIGEFCADHIAEIDRAFALDFSEHLYDDELVEVFKSVHSCLRAGGRFYIHTPNRDFLIEILKARGIMKQLPEHIAVRNGPDTAALLERAGFGEIRVAHLAHYLPALAWLDRLADIPGLGRFMRARLFIDARP